MGSNARTTGKVVIADLNYYLDPAKGGHTFYQVGTSSYYRRKYETHSVPIYDIRGQENHFILESNGFQYHKHISIENDFLDDNQVKRLVYPETEQLIKDLTGARKVHTFSHMIRRDSREEVEAAVNDDPSLQDGNAPIKSAVPARFIHVDFSEKGALRILQDNFDHELGKELSQARWAIINLWRPIKPIAKDPLAICDSASVKDDDLIPVTAILPRNGNGQYGDLSGGDEFEACYLRYSPDEKWYFVDKMEPDEVLLFKCFDSLDDGSTARRCPHSAFINPDTAADPTRESIELRSLVFFNDTGL
ncbi:hypothetical protein BKA67DRAFT_573869 [Truncatella angustata]|uniref:Methyltransferase n=1 Tax=Truncatella angustata TaxID=152316 RepID=A0A9P8UHS9_9PEZI|nr:uncharacterized protein BKA67DRAFT_573869 [Truncatella angustata]KAH6652403.1 hypothetical protein BKA67DRAFT_573869 [Truncatella angustata]